MTAVELRAARLAMGVGTPKLGKLLGVNPRTVRAWEAGQYPVPRTVELAMRELGRKTPA